MYCKKCGKQIPDDSRFCPLCGTDNAMEAPEEVTETISFQASSEYDSNERFPEKQKEKGKAKIVWAIIALAIVGIAVFAAITFFNPVSSNTNDSGIQVYAFKSARKTVHTAGSIDDLKSFYSKYYLYKDGNKWALFDPKTKAELKIDNSDGMKEVEQSGSKAIAYYIIDGEKWAVFTYVRVSQSEEESIISAIKSKPSLFP